MEHLEKVFIGVILLLNDSCGLLALISNSVSRSIVSRTCNLSIVSPFSDIRTILIRRLVVLLPLL